MAVGWMGVVKHEKNEFVQVREPFGERLQQSGLLALVEANMLNENSKMPATQQQRRIEAADTEKRDTSAQEHRRDK